MQPSLLLSHYRFVQNFAHAHSLTHNIFFYFRWQAKQRHNVAMKEVGVCPHTFSLACSIKFLHGYLWLKSYTYRKVLTLSYSYVCVKVYHVFSWLVLCIVFQLSTNQLRELEETQHPLVVRKRALAVEKERAKHVAVYKPHPTQPLIKVSLTLA